MFDLLYNNLDIRKKKYLIVPMCAIFHLLASCEKKLNNGSLQGVDALFGCSVVLFNSEDIGDLSTEELETACNILFYTINWFKELLNAFMFNTEEENHQTRLISRLRSVLAMEYTLEHLMQQVPHYAPLELHTSHSAESVKTTAALSIIDSPSQSSVSESQSHTKSKSNNASSSSSKPHAGIRMNSIHDLRSYTRAFEVDVLELLRYNEQVEEEESKLTLEEIDYILQDIEQKLDIKIILPAPMFFGKKKAAHHQENSCNFLMLSRISARTLMKKVT